MRALYAVSIVFVLAGCGKKPRPFESDASADTNTTTPTKPNPAAKQPAANESTSRNEPTTPSTPPVQPVGAPPETAPEFDLSFYDILREYEKNVFGADAKCLNKIGIITIEPGELAELGKKNGKSFIGINPLFPPSGIRYRDTLKPSGYLFFQDGQEATLAKIAGPVRLRIRGKCTGKDDVPVDARLLVNNFHVNFVGCTVVSMEEIPQPKLAPVPVPPGRKKG